MARTYRNIKLEENQGGAFIRLLLEVTVVEVSANSLEQAKLGSGSVRLTPPGT
jgi:hypothetical protein